MCGRFTHLYTWKQLDRLLSLVSPDVLLENSFNVAPTDFAPVVVYDEEAKMRRGLLPRWAKEIKGKPLDIRLNAATMP